MFITEDPIRDGLNWYTYCDGNPVNFIDPTGHAKATEVVKYNFKDSSRDSIYINKNYEGLLRAFENLIEAHRKHYFNEDYYHAMAIESREIISSYIIGGNTELNELMREIATGAVRYNRDGLYAVESAFDLAVKSAKASNQTVENIKGLGSEIVDVWVGPGLTYLAGSMVLYSVANLGNMMASLKDIPTSKLQHTFKHAGDFGIIGNWNKANGQLLEEAIKAHINNPANTIIEGTYRGDAVRHFYNAATGVNASVDYNGNFVAGWKLGADQMYNLFVHGGLN